MPDETPSLAGPRVIDLTTGELGALAAKLLADQGADVLKVEPPGGDPARWIGPFAGDRPDPDLSLDFWHYNSGKRNAVIDLGTAEGQSALKRLAVEADLVIESFPPGWLAARGLGPADLRAGNPALVVTSISPFGQTGPHRDHRSTEIVGWAASGYMSRCGDPDRAPLMGGVMPARQIAGLTAAIGSLAAVLHARQTGQGAHLDVSQQESITSLGEAMVMMYTHEKQLYRRNGADYPLVVPMIILPAADGYVHAVSVTVGQWEQLTTMLAIDDAVEDLLEEKWADNIARRANRDHVIGVIKKWLADRPKHETMIRAQEEFRLPFAVTATTEDAANDPQLAALEFWAEVDQPAIGRRVRQAGPSPRFRDRARPTLRPAPRLGEEGMGNRDWGIASGPEGQWSPDPSSPIPHPQSPIPLQGLRVVDFTWAYAGPWAARTLADLGADVIKLEQPEVGDMARGLPPFPTGQKSLNGSGYFFMSNHNKRSIALDLKTPAGRDLALRLATSADVVIDNFSAGVLDRLGLGPEALRAVNPRLIVVQMPGFGDVGPRAKYVGFAPSIESLSGIANLTGWPGRAPSGMGTAIPDPWGGLNAAYAALLGLIERERTGVGCAIESPMVAAGATMLGVEFLDYFVNGRVAEAQGNRPRGRELAPHGAYPCAPRPSDGEADRWVALAVETDEDWVRLRQVMGDPGWAADPALVTAVGRVARSEEVDARVGEWTRGFDARALADTLQAAGLPAAVVQDGRDVVDEDPHLRARGFWERVPHPEMGEVVADRSPFVIDGERAPLRRRPPLYCEHTDEILREWLGLDDMAIEEAKRDGGVYTPPA